MSTYITDAKFSMISTLVKSRETHLALYNKINNTYQYVEYPKIRPNVNILHINLEMYFEKNLSLDHLKEGNSGSTIYVYIEDGSIGQEMTVIFTPIFNFTTLNIASLSGDNFNLTKYVSKIIFTGEKWENSWSSSSNYQVRYNIPEWSDYTQDFDSLTVGERLVDSNWNGWQYNTGSALLIDNSISRSGQNSGRFNVNADPSDVIFSLSNLSEGTYRIQFSIYADTTTGDITADRVLSVLIVNSGFAGQYGFNAHVENNVWVKNIFEIDYTNKVFTARYEAENGGSGGIRGPDTVPNAEIYLLNIYVAPNGTPTSNGAFYIDDFSLTKI